MQSNIKANKRVQCSCYVTQVYGVYCTILPILPTPFRDHRYKRRFTGGTIGHLLGDVSL
jgi:hypothetical protein